MLWLQGLIFWQFCVTQFLIFSLIEMSDNTGVLILQAKSERGSVLMKQGKIEEARAQFTDVVSNAYCYPIF